MRRTDETPLDPSVEAYLAAVDSTLAGDAVDPRFADVAEVALLLADDRPRVGAEFARSLDERVGRRFAAPPESAPVPAADGAFEDPSGPRWPTGLFARLSLAGAALAAVIALVVVVAGSGGGSPSVESFSSASTPSGIAAPSAAAGSLGASGGSSRGAASAGSSGGAASAGSSGGAASAGSSSGSSASGPGAIVTPPPNGRKVVQSAQLQLATSPDRIDAVAQEVFDVVGTAGGIVDSSAVTQTGGSDGYASFSLRVPSGNLPQTMARLSSLPEAQVLSRTDNSQDVNDEYVSTTRALADAQALRKSLLGQLAAATTTGQIDSLKAQIKDAEASIGAAEAKLGGLNAQINYSRVMVTVSPRSTPAPVAHGGGGGFTLGSAAHVAGRVLVVAAGGALIALAVLVPLGLVVAGLGWAGALVRRRRREHALDVA